jgi:DNA-binding NarL/FixJ family response regulator
MRGLRCADRGYTTYPPSVLIVTDCLLHALRLKRRLESEGCQVDCTGTNPAGMATACRKYLDLIVLDLEDPDAGGSEVCQKLRADAQLTDVPVVILATCSCAGPAMSDLPMGKVYCLSNVKPDGGDPSIEAKLLGIIEQIHYLTYRYA